MGKVFIIAEAGVNHNGCVNAAVRMIDAAADAGADAVKFQTFKTESIVDSTAPKAEYQKSAGAAAESQYDMLKRLELSYDDFRRLYKHCDAAGIEFMSTAFDLESADFLHDLGMKTWKVPSGEVTNLPLLKKIGGFGGPVIVSTGMCTLGDVESCLDVLLSSGVTRDQVTVLHCTTEYPAPVEEVNLRAMLTIADAFKVKTGYSDHATGIEVSIAAAALGAAVIEKHFTLDRNLPGPDHRASITPDELSLMVRSIRNISLALGDGIKRVTEAEAKNLKIARKSIVASRAIKKGEIFSGENLTVKRPGAGVSPMKWEQVIGTAADRGYEKDEAIDAF